MSGSAGVLLVTDAYPPSSGGSGWSTHALAVALGERGWSVEVLHLARGLAAEVGEYEGVAVYRVPLAPPSLPARLGAADYSFDAVRTTVAERLHQRPDISVVHGQHLHSAPGAIAAARAAGVAALATVRDYWPVRLDGVAWPGEADGPASATRMRRSLVESFAVPPWLAPFAVPLARRRLNWRRARLQEAHRILAVSRCVARRLGPLTTPVDVVANLVDKERIERAADSGQAVLERLGVQRPYLFAAGKFNRVKGFDRLLPELTAAGNSMPVVVAGDGPLARDLARQASACPFEVRCVGWLNGNEVAAMSRAAHAVVVPSAWEEPLARVLLEAMTLGTPVLARATGGSPEIVRDRDNGWLYDSAAALEAALVALSEESGRAAAADGALRTAAERFAPEVVLPQVEAAYAAAVASARS